MSVDGQVLGVSTVAGGGGVAAATLADTGSPLLVGMVVGVAVIVIASVIARVSMK